ncbi:probable chitinase 3 [Pseudomyrmex gracilis]|uniref:probable chitinase 3 n=1 Tax=Pseudomyrmex gracilis TaxID=219809 RepID=UPI0009951F01|nr:probable chitinase 3 [Pseudomyrmex gracilis]
MKGIYAIVIAFVASWMTVITADLILPVPTECPVPQPNEKNTTTNLAHESDCTKFYKCHVGQRIEQLCPLASPNSKERLHYNIFEQVCDWPWRAGCESCPPAKDEQDRTLPSSKIQRSGSCRNYYRCKKGKAEKDKCSPDTCFSRTCQKCVDYRDGGSCNGDGPTLTKPPCRTGEKQLHHCDCNKYYVCVNNADLAVEYCDPGFHFSPTEEKCLPPDEANCPLDKI